MRSLQTSIIQTPLKKEAVSNLPEIASLLFYQKSQLDSGSFSCVDRAENTLIFLNCACRIQRLVDTYKIFNRHRNEKDRLQRRSFPLVKIDLTSYFTYSLKFSIIIDLAILMLEKGFKSLYLMWQLLVIASNT